MNDKDILDWILLNPRDFARVYFNPKWPEARNSPHLARKVVEELILEQVSKN
jgi:hypothetical protein